ncbi:NUDIX hydrolase [bacterium]|nr:NUDIX hydrolase [bacterium]
MNRSHYGDYREKNIQMKGRNMPEIPDRELSVESGAWKRRSSRLVYENQWMKLHEDQVTTPSGTDGVYGWLELQEAVVVLAISEKDEVVLIGQERYPVQEYSWELIEGGIESSETPLQAARRELKEEAGIIPASLIPLGSPFHIANTRTNELAHVFLATGLEFGNAQPEETEVLQQMRLPVEEVYEMVDDGTIRDSLSIIALLRYRVLFSR